MITANWEARTLFRDGEIDVVPNRQESRGVAKAVLVRALNDGILDAVREKARSLPMENDEAYTLFETSAVKVTGRPAWGYLYLEATLNEADLESDFEWSGDRIPVVGEIVVLNGKHARHATGHGVEVLAHVVENDHLFLLTSRTQSSEKGFHYCMGREWIDPLKESDGCTVARVEGLFYMYSPRTGTHTLGIEYTDEKRLQAHWDGFLENQKKWGASHTGGA
jgi:hypothetical protein